MLRSALFFFLVSVVSVWSQSRNCTLSSNPIAARAEGLTEATGDIFISCTGGVIVPQGQPLPVFNVQVSIPQTLGNRVILGQFTDVLLLVNEPLPGNQFPCTSDPCPGIAGAFLGADAGQNRNVFQGRINGSSGVSFQVPLQGGVQTLRIVNLRTVATQIPNQALNATVSMSGPENVFLNTNTARIANVAPSLNFAVRAPDDAATLARLDPSTPVNAPISASAQINFNLRFTETAPFGFRKRAIAANAAAPGQIATQANPGQQVDFNVLNSETGFFNQSFPAINGLSAAGLAESGTRLIARFSNIPNGVFLYVTTRPVAAGTSANGIGAQLLSTDANGFGPLIPAPIAATIGSGDISQLQVSNGQATAVWEVLEPTTSIDSLSFGVVVSYSVAPTGTITVQGSYGPAAPSGNVTSAPRFVALANAVEAVTIGAAGPVGGGGGGGGGTVVPFAIATPPILLSGTVGQGYPATSFVTNPPLANLTWSVVQGSVPPGMLFSTSGVLSGTPSTPGIYTFTARAQDPFGNAALATFSLFVRGTSLNVSGAGVLQGTIGTFFGPFLLGAGGGTPPYRWTAQSGTLPPGITLSENGAISGIPTADGRYSTTVFVVDANSLSASTNVTFFIFGALTIQTPAPLPNALVNGNYDAALETAGGLAPYAWNLASGSLPSGITLDPAGRLTGIPRSAGLASFVLQARDSSGRGVSRAYTIETFTQSPAVTGVRALPNGLRFHFTPGAQARAQVLQFTSIVSPGVPLSLRATTDRGGWLTLDRQSVSAPGTVNVLVNPAGLTAGTYRGVINYTASDGSGDVPVIVTIGPAPSALTLVPSGLVFTATAGAAAPPPQTVYLFNPSDTAIPWTASIQGRAGLVSTRDSSGTIPAGFTTALSISANPAGLAPGDHHAQLNITADGGTVVQSLTATLRILDTDQPPALNISAGAVLLIGSTTAEVQVTNNGRLQESYFLSRQNGQETTNWFSVTPPTATLDAGLPARVTFQRAPGASTSSSFTRGAVSLGVGGGSTRTIDVFALNPPNPCTASRLLPILTSHGNDFTAITGSAQLIEARIVDDCGRPFTNGAAVMYSSTGETSALQSLGDGRWVGSWTAQPTGAASSPVTLAVSAQDLLGLLRGSFQTTGLVLTGSMLQPRVQNGAAVSGGSFERHRPLAPGGFVSLFGEALAERSSAATQLPLETNVAGTRVTIGQRNLPIAFLSANQINAVIPYDVPTGRPLPLTVWRNETPSTPETVIVARTSPDLFLAPQPAITDTSFRPINNANPARTGDVIVVFCTGLGSVTPAVMAGAAAPANPVSVVEANVQALVGGQPAEMLGAALTPGFTGLYQVAVRIPQGLTAAAITTVAIVADGASSPNATIPLRQ